MSPEERILSLRDAGDLDGAATLAIRSYGPLVLRYLRPLLRAEEDVADAFSVWAENVWRGLARFEGRAAVRTWSIRLACNAGLNLRDRAHRKRERRLATTEASALAEEVRSRSAERVERQRRRLLELRARLTPAEQTLLFLRVDQELGWAEIASILSASGDSVTDDSAAKRFERLKERLRKLAGEGAS